MFPMSPTVYMFLLGSWWLQGFVLVVFGPLEALKFDLTMICNVIL